MRRLALFALVATMTLTVPVAAQQTKTGNDTDGHPYLESPSGRTLYVYDADGGATLGTACTGECAKIWAPFGADGNTKAHGDWTLLKRVDGGQQWVYKGRPLYTYDKDAGPGQRNGNSFEGNPWHVAQP